MEWLLIITMNIKDEKGLLFSTETQMISGFKTEKKCFIAGSKIQKEWWNMAISPAREKSYYEQTRDIKSRQTQINCIEIEK